MGENNNVFAWVLGGVNGLVDIDQTYDPESENPQSGKAVAEALVHAKGIVRVSTEDATYEQLKSYIDSGKHVVLSDGVGAGATYYALWKITEDFEFVFACYLGTECRLLTFSPDGTVSTSYKGMLDEECVQHTFDETSKLPISGEGVAEVVRMLSLELNHLKGVVVVLSADETNHTGIARQMELGRQVVIVKEVGDEKLYYTLASSSESGYTFICPRGAECFMLSFLKDGTVSSVVPLLTEGHVQNTYNPTSKLPISGEGVAEALATASGGGENDIELVATGETAEAVNTIKIDKFLNGEPLALCDMISIYFYSPKAAEDLLVTVDINNRLTVQIPVIKASTEQYAKAVALFTGFEWETIYSIGGTASNNYLYVRGKSPFNSNGTITADAQKIVTSMQFYIYNSAKTIPEGFKYRVYGRRAKI